MNQFIPMLNLFSLVFFGIWGSISYIKSVQPARWESVIGSIAYDRCTKLRNKSRYILSISLFSFFIYNVYPAFLGFSDKLFESYSTSTFSSLITLIPGLLVFFLGRKALGKESMSPKKYRSVYDNGIYSLIRHPQHLGELCFWYSIAIFMNSIFLVIFTTLFWVPNYILWCYYEEKDLVLRYGDSYDNYRKKTKKLIPFVF